MANVPEPKTREELYLAKAAGNSVDTPTPETRLEMYLDAISQGGGGGGELSADLIVSNPIGRFAQDETIDEGTPFETIFRGMLSKTYYPALTDPAASIVFNVPALMKVGATIPQTALTAGFNRGSINPQYTAESGYRSGEATGYNAKLTGASIAYDEDKADGNFTVPAFTREVKGNVIATATVSYAAGVQPKDSDGNDYQSPLPAGTKSASKTIEFILPFYWGKSALPSLASLAVLTEDLAKKGSRQYTYADAADEYLYIAYDAAYGNLAHITDELNYENVDVWQRSELIFEGNNYIIYRSAFAITGSPAFKFSF